MPLDTMDKCDDCGEYLEWDDIENLEYCPVCS